MQQTSETYISVAFHGGREDAIKVQSLMRHDDGTQSFDICIGDSMRFVRLNLNREQITDLARGVQAILENWDRAAKVAIDAL